MKTNILTTILVTASLALSTTTYAQSNFAKSHPRRAEVNQRLTHQNKRIHDEVKEGDLSRRQAANLHRQDRSIRHEERRMAAHHNGHLAKHDQNMLNKRENNVSKRIGK